MLESTLSLARDYLDMKTLDWRLHNLNTFANKTYCTSCYISFDFPFPFVSGNLCDNIRKHSKRTTRLVLRINIGSHNSPAYLKPSEFCNKSPYSSEAIQAFFSKTKSAAEKTIMSPIPFLKHSGYKKKTFGKWSF